MDLEDDNLDGEIINDEEKSSSLSDGLWIDEENYFFGIIENLEVAGTNIRNPYSLISTLHSKDVQIGKVIQEGFIVRVMNLVQGFEKGMICQDVNHMKKVFKDVMEINGKRLGRKVVYLGKRNFG